MGSIFRLIVSILGYFGTTKKLEPLTGLNRVIGQKKQVEQLKKTLRHKSIIVLEGPPGVGKSLSVKEASKDRSILPERDLSLELIYDFKERKVKGKFINTSEKEKEKKEKEEKEKQNSESQFVFPNMGEVLIDVVRLTLGFLVFYIWADWLVILYHFVARSSALIEIPSLGGFVYVTCHNIVLSLIFYQIFNLIQRFFRSRDKEEEEPKKRILDLNPDPIQEFNGNVEGQLQHSIYGYKESNSGGGEFFDPGVPSVLNFISLGCAHSAHGGFLFIDEAELLEHSDQLLLLSAIEDKKMRVFQARDIDSDFIPLDFGLILCKNHEERQTGFGTGFSGQMFLRAFESRIASKGRRIIFNSEVTIDQNSTFDFLRMIKTELELRKKVLGGEYVKKEFDLSSLNFLLCYIAFSNPHVNSGMSFPLEMRPLIGLINQSIENSSSEIITLREVVQVTAEILDNSSSVRIPFPDPYEVECVFDLENSEEIPFLSKIFPRGEVYLPCFITLIHNRDFTEYPLNQTLLWFLEKIHKKYFEGEFNSLEYRSFYVKGFYPPGSQPYLQVILDYVRVKTGGSFKKGILPIGDLDPDLSFRCTSPIPRILSASSWGSVQKIVVPNYQTENFSPEGIPIVTCNTIDDFIEACIDFNEG